jgi:hypothetical protein
MSHDSSDQVYAVANFGHRQRYTQSLPEPLPWRHRYEQADDVAIVGRRQEPSDCEFVSRRSRTCESDRLPAHAFAPRPNPADCVRRQEAIDFLAGFCAQVFD